MRGKKSDPQFVSQFISQCIQDGFTTPEAMVQAARMNIQYIDDKIKEVERLKITRSKLLDVIATFDQPEVKLEQAKLLPFFRLKYPNICKNICDNLKDKDDRINTDDSMKDLDRVFCIKEMLECKIICRHNEYIMRGDRFHEYIQFVLRLSL
jgi:hypothetical protein